MMQMRPLFLCFLVASAACKERREAPGPEAPAAGSAAPTAAAAQADPEPEAPAPPDQAEVQATVEAWLAAQNQGDFAAYQALYADKLEGIKRVGARTWRFGREGWMADRQRMFGKPMKVAVRELEIGGSARTPVVSLVQSFRQGKFADEGPKRMVFTRAGGALRIAREEMLSSTVAKAAAPVAGAAMLTVTLGTTSYAVLDEPADPSWGTGKLEGPMLGDGGASFALRAAAKAPAAKNWQGRKLRVYAASGEACQAQVARLVLLSGGTPHFGEVQAWDGQDGAPTLSRGQRARAVFELAPPVLAAELALEGRCGPVRLAVEEGSAAVPYQPVAAPAALAADAVAAFRKLPAYRALQADFTGNYGGTGEWAATPQTLVAEHGANRVVLVWAKQGVGCGDFYGALTAVFTVTPENRLRLSSSQDPGYFEPKLVLDLEGDGTPEIVGTPDDFSTVSAIYRSSDASTTAMRSLAFPFNDCGC